MTSAIVFIPPNRLESLLSNPLAPTADMLVSSAQHEMAGLRDRLRGDLAAALTRLFALAQLPETELFGASRELGLAALSIVELAAVVGRPALGEAARGVYHMVEALIEHGAWHTEALLVHVEALHLLAEPATTPEITQTVLARLMVLRERVGIVDTPSANTAIRDLP